ncbi:MAG TPA: dihydrofolate reductase [Candidatus Obscuribacterales bacterium]
MIRNFDIVVAADLNGGIGKDGSLPWRLSGDMAYFKRLTTAVTEPGKRNAVIMGRKTWQSIPPKFRPLKDRLNIVLSRDGGQSGDNEVLFAASLDDALVACDCPDVQNVFVIGGAAVYAQALEHPACRLVYLTEVRSRFQCDTYLPAIDEKDFALEVAGESVQQDGDVQYVFKVYRRKSSAMSQPDRMPVVNP